MSAPSSSPSNIAIIGASLSGLELTLALLKAELYRAEEITIYEARRQDYPDLANRSGVVLTPNGLKVLDSIGILNRIRHNCWQSRYRTYRNDKDELVRKTLVANEELYGYTNHRIWRRSLQDALLSAVNEKGVRIIWNAKFEYVVHEVQDEVHFMVNGKEHHAGLLIGADGIYSGVRKYLDPDAGPEYTGTMGVLAHIQWDDVQWPTDDYERNCTIQGKPGALFWIPEDKEGSVIMIGKQVKMPGKSRQELEEMAKDEETLCNFYRKDYDEWGSTAQQIIDAVCRNKDTFYVWPFLKMSKLQKWISDKGRVIIVGDAAHAIPPSSGQGVNQTLEDVHTLTRVLKEGPDRVKALNFWQCLRQKRVDDIYDWSMNVTNVQRLPQADRDKLVREGKAKDGNVTKDYDDMRWLYNSTADQQINDWLREQS